MLLDSGWKLWRIENGEPGEDRDLREVQYHRVTLSSLFSRETDICNLEERCNSRIPRTHLKAGIPISRKTLKYHPAGCKSCNASLTVKVKVPHVSR